MPDATPVQLDLDVVVTPQFVFLYPNGSDLAFPDCTGGSQMFPQPGSAAFYDDVWNCTPGDTSCLTSVAVQVGGTTYAGDITIGKAIGMQASVIGAADATLEIAGCGAATSIPIGNAAAPVPTATAAVDTNAKTITVTWSAVPAAASALLTFDASTWGNAQHVTTSPYVFATMMFPIAGYSGVSVTSFAAPNVVATAFGDVRVWTGDVTSVPLK